ncbi:MAG TPA: tRNA pseudouridine(13) synthase TruD [Candidatus Acidoferrales bacterium]|nr:tRNA pseudouridine(13) synthase TruD [Candidatus Acidoferrales bacterium]
MIRLSASGQMGGIIKQSAQDFIVEEIVGACKALDKDKVYSESPVPLTSADPKFSIFVMQKENWNTVQALKAVARVLKRGQKSTGFAGTKDRVAISTQMCSIFGVTPEQLLGVHVKDIRINGAWSSDAGIKMGDLQGNRFTIVVRGATDTQRIEEIHAELGGKFPNYFGPQRFGSRGNNFDIGIALLKGDFKTAAMEFLTNSTNETNIEAVAARKKLAEEQDFEAAFRYFPMHLKYERMMLEYLSKFSANFASSIKRLPRAVSLMFIHSVEAQIFNMELEEMVKARDTAVADGDLACALNACGFPDISAVAHSESFIEEKESLLPIGNIVGYETKNLNEFELEALEKLGITTDSFKVRGMNELNSKGTYRPLFAPYTGFASDTLDEGKAASFSFSLPSGSYATVLLNEFISGTQAENL